MKYIVMCGGEYSHWETPRQLLEIRGEPMVGRTIRLLREAGAEDIAISTHDRRFGVFGVPLLEHENSFTSYVTNTLETCDGAWVDAFYPTDVPACYLMGDVFFSPEAIRTIVETETDGVQYFASAPPFAETYIKPWAEPFAFKVADQARFRKAIDWIRANMGKGVFRRHPIAWELWQVINDEDPNMLNFENYCVINDYTCDIDHPYDVDRILRAIGE